MQQTPESLGWCLDSPITLREPVAWDYAWRFRPSHNGLLG